VDSTLWIAFHLSDYLAICKVTLWRFLDAFPDSLRLLCSLMFRDQPVKPCALGLQGPYWPIALSQKTLSFNMAASIDLHAACITTLFIFWMQIFRIELQFSAKSRLHFLFRFGDIEN